MRNPEATKEAILKASAQLFNIQGYKATSISDITKELGMTKGAIYRHFENKSVLEREALIYMTHKMMYNLGAAIRNSNSVSDKMNAIFDYFAAYAIKTPEKGGCPLLNAAIESDDANEELNKVVNGIIQSIHHSIAQVLRNGIKHNQLKSDIDPEGFSSIIFSSLEGAIMLVKVTGSANHMHSVINHLRKQFNNYLK